MKDVLILPDIHGRSFWREAVKNLSPDDYAIFLGDYADPYPHEGISPEEAWINLLDIIVFAKEHPTLTFLVTRIGCGIAGFTDGEISPLFEEAHEVENIVLPPNW